MSQNTNLNVSPYFDDFNENRNYNKVLFKPGFPVQARELTTLQSILQNQIERFGQHFFKEGSMIIPGGTSYDSEYFAVRIDPNFLSIPVNTYTKFLADNKIKIQGETTGVEATVINRLTAAESVDGFDTLYVKYTKSGTDGTTRVFQDGENLITLSNISYLNTNIATNSQFARCIVSDATKVGSAFSVSEGVYFIHGYFVKVNSSTVILDQYSNTPSYRVGFLLKEQFISASTTNSDLYDNARGFANESAPGADRLKISTTLHRKALDDRNDGNFTELLRVENGVVKEIVSKTEYNIFADELARRTYDESGDYYVKPFSIDVRESLNDRISNRGIYFDTQQTQNGNTPADDILSLQLSSGKAYVRGYEVDKISSSSIDVLKPRTTKLVDNQSVPIRIGNSVEITNVFGTPEIGFSDTLRLLNRRLDSTNSISGYNSTVIGKMRAFDFAQKSVIGATSTVYDLKFYDLQLYSVLTVATQITVTAGSHIEGKYSGSSGFAVYAGSGNPTSVTITDVTGQFQINEPIVVNGIDVGTSITSVVDNSFEDIKAIHSSGGVINGDPVGTGATTFTANTVLNREKLVFKTGAEFQITTVPNSGVGDVRGPSVVDFRTIVKSGDIISYSGLFTQNVPSFNEVTGIGAGGTNFTVSGIATVSGVNDGGIRTGDLISDLVIRVPSLNESDDAGFRVKLADKYVSSMNILDSSYIARKKLSKTWDSSTITFNISEIGGDTSNLFFEPFSSSNYTLTLNGVVEDLGSSGKVVVSTNLKTVTISSLSGSPTGQAVLTAAVRRSALSSKEKSLVRCNSLVVDKSELAGSGIGTTSLNDGLIAGSYPYGTRVQDREISLNVPEVTRVLAIFESNEPSSNPPTLPAITVTNQTETFTGNVLVGEQFIGGLSGAVARVVTIGATQLSFVYENENRFEIGENISLKTSGIFATISAIVFGDRNIIKNFTLDNGQRREFADFSRIVRKSGIEKPTGKLRIIFDKLLNDEASGNVETVNSYNALDYSRDVPFVFDSFASDYIDFRPRVAPYTASSNSPFSFTSRDFSGTTSESIVSGKSMVVDYSYYMGRIDRLYLSKSGVFSTKEGKPSRLPKSPLPNEDAFQVATIKYPPYVRNASDVSVKRVPHKRFTMRDIGSLESRIKNLENYTTLSLLETDTKNLSIKDPNTGLDKFKSGFFVDNFRNHNSHNLTGESKFDIDIQKSELRPRSTERNVGLVFETKSTTTSPSTADYKFASDFSDSNITRGGASLTLNYTEDIFIDQPNATRTENLNPFLVDVFVGTIELVPSSDFWIEEIALTPQNIELDNAFDAISQLLGVEDRENGGMASSFWNSHEQTWNGRDSATLIDEDVVGSQILSLNSTQNVTNQGNLWTTTTTTTTDLRNTIQQTFEETGVEREFGLELSANEQVVDLGTKVVGIDILYNVRSRNIEVTASRVKPNTRFFVFMENTDLTQFAIPKYLPIEMNEGAFSVGEEVESISSETDGTPSIKFRVASPNHKDGDYNNPTETISTYPPNTSVPTVYSSTSTILNVDTADLALENNIDHIGWVKKGTVLATAAGAQATVGDLALVSDDKGDLIFSLHIPNPKITGNPLFTTGNNTIRITTSSVNSSILDPGSSSAETEYLASGYQTSTQEQTINIKTPQVERVEVGTRDITRTFNETRTEQVTTVDVDVQTQRIDPLAQSFLIYPDVYPDGIFITSGELFFKTKDDEVPVTVQIRTMKDGTPTKTVVPFGETKIKSEDINLSDDGSAVTTFKFKSPVYLQGGYEYCMVLMAPHTLNYLAFINRMGESDLITQGLNSNQPVLGSLFKSQNNSTWTPSQYEDLKFKLNRAKFVTNTPSSVLLFNSELPLGKILKQNPVTAYSKRSKVAIASTVTTFTAGDEVTQSGNTGRIFASGGKVSTGNSKLTIVSTSGSGLKQGQYNGIGFTALTGFGDGLTANVSVSASGVITGSGVTIAAQGSGYAVGDLLLMNPLGTSGGSGVRVVVANTTETNLLVVDNIKDKLVSTAALSHIKKSNGVTITIPAADITSVNDDPIRDGYTLKFDHKNHGMHSGTNKVEVVNFHPDTLPTTLSNDITNESSSISLTSGTNFVNFEGTAVSGSVGSGHTGYLLIDKEIISYNTISGNEISDFVRGIDQSLKSNHAANAPVYRYEFNGVSLRKINKDNQDIDPREKTFDSYYLKVADDSKAFDVTRTGGGDHVMVSQNIPFEVISPQITSITPTGTNITSRVKTTGGTSLSGSEASFTDKGYQTVALNKLNYFDDPRIIASKENEYHLLSNQKSFALELTLTTDNEDVSPVVDLETANVIAISNLVDDKVTDFETASGPKIPGSDPNTAIYETKLINLEFVSNSLFVQFDGHREAEGDIRVFYKLVRGDGNDDYATYIPFNSNGSPDKEVKSNASRNAFSEYKFTAENTPQFTGFMIKVVMTSTNQAKPPRIKNFRSIALRSFDIV